MITMLARSPSLALDESGRFSRSCWTRATPDNTGGVGFDLDALRSPFGIAGFGEVVGVSSSGS